jgi:hypothetical protein
MFSPPPPTAWTKVLLVFARMTLPALACKARLKLSVAPPRMSVLLPSLTKVPSPPMDPLMMDVPPVALKDRTWLIRLIWPFRESGPFVAVQVCELARMMSLLSVWASPSLLVIPPAPRVSVLPPMVKAPAVLLKLSELMPQLPSVKGVSRVVPPNTTSAVPFLAGASSRLQLEGVLQLSLAPPPSQVCAHAGLTTPQPQTAATSVRIKVRNIFVLRDAVRVPVRHAPRSSTT